MIIAKFSDIMLKIAKLSASRRAVTDRCAIASPAGPESRRSLALDWRLPAATLSTASHTLRVCERQLSPLPAVTVERTGVSHHPTRVLAFSNTNCTARCSPFNQAKALTHRCLNKVALSCCRSAVLLSRICISQVQPAGRQLRYLRLRLATVQRESSSTGLHQLGACLPG